MGLPRGEETLFTPDEPDDPTRVMGWKRAGEVVGDGLSSASGCFFGVRYSRWRIFCCMAKMNNPLIHIENY
jgi:hypothetical protein